MASHWFFVDLFFPYSCRQVFLWIQWTNIESIRFVYRAFIEVIEIKNSRNSKITFRPTRIYKRRYSRCASSMLAILNMKATVWKLARKQIHTESFELWLPFQVHEKTESNKSHLLIENCAWKYQCPWPNQLYQFAVGFGYSKIRTRKNQRWTFFSCCAPFLQWKPTKIICMIAWILFFFAWIPVARLRYEYIVAVTFIGFPLFSSSKPIFKLVPLQFHSKRWLLHVFSWKERCISLTIPIPFYHVCQMWMKNMQI